MSDPHFGHPYNRPRFDYDNDRLRPDDPMGTSGALVVLAVLALLIGGLFFFTGDRQQATGERPSQMAERSAPAPAPPAQPSQ